MKTITVKSGTAEDGIKCFSTTGEPVEEYQGEAELVWQFKGHTLWHTCDRVTPELAKENGWDTRQVWIVPSPPAPEQNDIDVPLLNQSASKEPLEVPRYERIFPFDVNLEDTLIELLEYMEDRQDADHDGDNFVANEEMKYASNIRQLLYQLEKNKSL